MVPENIGYTLPMEDYWKFRMGERSLKPHFFKENIRKLTWNFQGRVGDNSNQKNFSVRGHDEGVVSIFSKLPLFTLNNVF